MAKDTYKHYLDECNSFFEAKDQEGLLKKVEEDILSNPDNPYCWYMKGKALSIKRNILVSEAFTAYEKVLQFDDTPLDVRLYIASVIQDLGYLSDALEQYDIVERKIDLDLNYILRKGHLLKDMGRYKDAKEYFTKAKKYQEEWINKHPDISTKQIMERMWELHNTCLSLGDYKQALIYYDKSIDWDKSGEGEEYLRGKGREELLWLVEQNEYTS